MRVDARKAALVVAVMTWIALATGCRSTSGRTGDLEGSLIPLHDIPAAQEGPDLPLEPPPSDSGTGVPAPTPTAPPPPTLDIPAHPTVPLPPAPPSVVVTASGMHIERHDGFDRVVYDFGGTWVPRRRAEYVAEATPRGAETAIPINARSILQIYFFDTLPPAESGIAAYSGPNPLSDPAAHSVVEVHLTPNFERTTQSFIGLRTGHPRFQVATLSEPTRVVVDIYE
ncbi:AMIN-like domain-containing (lipo)protein [Rhodococcus opacus]|uniref:AMIN-like domain-containing protein n=1 Tax=Rhodococcus opacus (strain B4) TaxID=632772 RepID=C1B6D0_RHOOB|nr:hypothetical protein [Rhodococcus opacus]BAH51233.1 hypothetical protein ROP_29860 [Rhodococcus opacus B4]